MDIMILLIKSFIIVFLSSKILSSGVKSTSGSSSVKSSASSLFKGGFNGSSTSSSLTFDVSIFSLFFSTSTLGSKSSKSTSNSSNDFGLESAPPQTQSYPKS
jgi:hypothetical protein